MSAHFLSTQTEVFLDHLFSWITETGSYVFIDSPDTYFSLEIGCSFATTFVDCKAKSFVSVEHKMNFTGKPDLGKRALKETDQFSSELQVIPLAFNFSV